MDLALYSRVLVRRRAVIFVGLAVAVLLATFSYYRLAWDGATPGLEPRKPELWQSQADIFLTESGFPAGRRTIPFEAQDVGGETVTVPRFNEPGRFASLAALYARLAVSDEVRQRVRDQGPPFGEIVAFPSVETSAGMTSALPIVTIIGRATSPEAATVTATRGVSTFVSYMAERQIAAGVPEEERVQLSVLNAPVRSILLQPRKKTLPVVVFLAVMMASVALAFILENASRSRRPVGAVSEPDPLESEPEPESEVSTIRRWA